MAALQGLYGAPYPLYADGTPTPPPFQSKVADDDMQAHESMVSLKYLDGTAIPVYAAGTPDPPVFQSQTIDEDTLDGGAVTPRWMAQQDTMTSYDVSKLRNKLHRIQQQGTNRPHEAFVDSLAEVSAAYPPPPPPPTDSYGRLLSHPRRTREADPSSGNANTDGCPFVISMGTVGHPVSCGMACKYVKRKSGCRDGAQCKQCHKCIWRRGLPEKPSPADGFVAPVAPAGGNRPAPGLEDPVVCEPMKLKEPAGLGFCHDEPAYIQPYDGATSLGRNLIAAVVCSSQKVAPSHQSYGSPSVPPVPPGRALAIGQYSAVPGDWYGYSSCGFRRSL